MSLKNRIFESINKIIEQTKAFIRKNDKGEWCVITEQTGKNMGCYKNKKDAENRLEQIKRFASIDQEDNRKENK